MKKKLPINLIRIINPILTQNQDLISFETSDEFMFKFVDKDSTSDFVFTIHTIDAKDDEYKITRKPKNKTNNSEFTYWMDFEEVVEILKDWINTISEYSSTNSVFDDPILMGFSEQYYDQIKILDEDADIRPFTVEQIIKLDKYLENVVLKLEDYRSNENSSEITNIVEETETLRKDLTKSTKNQVLKRLTRIWGKISKQGIPLIKGIVKEGIKEAIKIAVRTMLQG